MSKSDQYRERLDEFGSSYEDSETYELVKLIKATGSFLERLTGEPEAVNAAMKLLYEKTSNYPASGDLSWRECWDRADMDAGVISMSEYFIELNAYGYYGLQLQDGDSTDPASHGSDRERNWADHLKKGRDLLESVPEGWAEITELERTLLAAEARFSLDFGRDLSVEQLAALARMTPKSIRNLLTPKSGETDLRTNGEGMIPGADAMRWMSKREDFRTSIWMEAAENAELPSRPSNELLTDVMFIPVAKDGTAFDPVFCRNGRGYTIGPKGAEMPIDDYFEALRILTKASSPHWRRPNENGNWGIVAGISWQRRDAAELKSQLSSARQ